MAAVISERRWKEQKRQWENLFWQTKVLSQFIAATVPVSEEGEENKLLAAANRLGEPEDKEEEKVESSNKEPDLGSYEQFMAMFGRGLQR